MKYFYRIILISLLIAHSFKFALAVPPPDFIFNIGALLIQAFTFFTLGFSIVISILKRFFARHILFVKYGRIMWIILAALVVLASLAGAYWYSQYRQNQEYQDWIKQSTEHSQNVISQNLAEKKTEPQLAAPAVNDSAFFESQSNLPLVISNAEFAKIPSDAFVLDAREDEEFEIGYYPGSHHIRFADIKSGDWTKLPSDQIIYVPCWSGIRGQEVAEFLRSKKIAARYLEKGADGWVTFGGKWVGEIKFRSAFGADQYKIVFTTDQVRSYIKSGVVIVDSREVEKYNQRHIPGSISIPIIYTPSNKIAEVLAQVPPSSRVITVCDDFVSCFDATVVGVKLERLGDNFLGRYNKPWEY